jgi:hypothetical protein
VSQKTVLYVEDNEFNRKIVRQLLRRPIPRGDDGRASGWRRARPDHVQLPKMSARARGCARIRDRQISLRPMR